MHLRGLPRHCALLLTLTALGVMLARTGPASAQERSWQAIQNERFGFTLPYPAHTFVLATGKARDDAVLLVSKDGRAKLQASGSINTTRESAASYREFVVRTSYAQGKVTYTRTYRRTFVVAGTIGDQVFYERVFFGCSGNVITGWQMMYPAAERHYYDRVVEEIHRAWKPGAGLNAACRDTAADERPRR